jgi:hypothetical protein
LHTALAKGTTKETGQTARTGFTDNTPLQQHHMTPILAHTPHHTHAPRFLSTATAIVECMSFYESEFEFGGCKPVAVCGCACAALAERMTRISPIAEARLFMWEVRSTARRRWIFASLIGIAVGVASRCCGLLAVVQGPAPQLYNSKQALSRVAGLLVCFCVAPVTGRHELRQERPSVGEKGN